MRNTVFAAGFVVSAPFAASAATFDFEGFAPGTTINSVSDGGVTASITVTPNGNGLPAAQIFDTANPGSNADGDPDLGIPFVDAVTGAAFANPGNVLIVQEDPNADGGLDTNPDDAGDGGIIEFVFDQVVNILSFEVFDDVTNFTVTTDVAGQTETVNIGEDNEALLVLLNFDGVQTLTFDFGNASGAIDNITFEVPAIPLPAGMPLLLAGLAGLGYMSRRRRNV
ncbi:MAG: VPLPA-CTERM sorting domain-containing protein [Pseudomonadota bacterium]